MGNEWIANYANEVSISINKYVLIVYKQYMKANYTLSVRIVGTSAVITELKSISLDSAKKEALAKFKKDLEDEKKLIDSTLESLKELF